MARLAGIEPTTLGFGGQYREREKAYRMQQLLEF